MHRLRLYMIMLLMALSCVIRPVTSRAGRSIEMDRLDYERLFNDSRTLSIEELSKRAKAMRIKERYDSAAAFYTMAALRYDEHLPAADVRRCAIAAVDMGYIWLAWRMNPVEAYPWLMKAKAIAERHGIDDVMNAVTSNLGGLYLDYGNYAKAREYLAETLSNVIDSRSDRYVGMALMDFAAASLLAGDKNFDRELLDRVSAYEIAAPSAPMKSYTRRLTEAMRLFNDRRRSEAADIMTGSDSLIDLTIEPVRYRLMNALLTGKLLSEAGRTDDASQTYSRFLKTAAAEGSLNLVEKLCTELADCRMASGDSAGAGRYRLMALDIRDSLYNNVGFDAVKNLETSTALRGYEKRMSAEQSRSRRQHDIMVILSVVGVILTALLIWLAVSRRKLQNAYKEIFKRNIELAGLQREPQPQTTANATTDDFDEAKGRELLERIMAVIDTSDSIFNPDFSVETLAAAVDSKPKAVSQAINAVAGKNFNTFLAEYRIREACRLLTDPDEMKRLTVETVAERVGYRSRTYFSRVFKSITGLTPTQFIKQARLNS